MGKKSYEHDLTLRGFAEEQLSKLFEQQGVSYDRFIGLFTRIRMLPYRLLGLEISGRGNSYPAHPGNLVMVLGVGDRLDLSDPKKAFEKLSVELKVEFNNPASVGEMCAANVFGSIEAIGNINRLETLLVVLKKV